jgi:prepilin-type N-terminal cleavage/methylation domain-containing protein
MLDIGLLVLFYIVALRGKSNVMKRKTSFFCEDRPARLEMAGFTLVEMAIVILIMGILLVPILEAYSHYIKEKRIEDTRENIAAVTSGISGFQDVQARLPCPADATLGPGAANFGKEFDVNCNPAAIGLTAAGMCTAGNGICLVAGQRNLGGAAGATDANELVLIGAVPIVSMRDQGVSERTAVANDAWGRKLTYAVTASLTQRRLPTLPMSERSGFKMNLETIQPALMGMPTWLLFHMGKMEKAVLTKAGG